MQNIRFLEPLFADDENVLHQHKVPNQTLVWARALPVDLQETVRRLTQSEQHRRFIKALHDVWFKVELKNGALVFKKNCSRVPNVGRWKKTLTLHELFAGQNATSLVQDLEMRLHKAFKIFSSAQLNMRIFTRVSKYGIIKPAKFHTDKIYVMGLNYAAPCTEVAYSPELQPILSLPEGSVSIIPPGQIHRSPSCREGGIRFYAALF